MNKEDILRELRMVLRSIKTVNSGNTGSLAGYKRAELAEACARIDKVLDALCFRKIDNEM
jgi:hypothetical protein